MRSLKRLIIAGTTLNDIMQTTAALKNIDAHGPHGPVYYMAFSGIAVAYCRIFDETNYGLGSIGKKYEKFPDDSEHANTHADLLEGRRTAFAHYSPAQAANLLRNAKDIQDHQKVEMIVNLGGDVGFRAKIILWKTKNLRKIYDLCAFQDERIRSDAKKLVEHLGGDKVYAPGTYTIGESFP